MVAPSWDKVNTMADLFTSFSNTVDTLSAPRSSAPASSPSGSGIPSFFDGFFGSKKETTVKVASKPTFWQLLTGTTPERQVSVDYHGDRKATVTVKNTTGVDAYNLAMGNAPEERYKVAQVGDQVVVEATSNAGDSAWNQILGTTKSGWY
jgi:hypothetical protein